MRGIQARPSRTATRWAPLARAVAGPGSGPGRGQCRGRPGRSGPGSPTRRSPGDPTHRHRPARPYRWARRRARPAARPPRPGDRHQAQPCETLSVSQAGPAPGCVSKSRVTAAVSEPVSPGTVETGRTSRRRCYRVCRDRVRRPRPPPSRAARARPQLAAARHLVAATVALPSCSPARRVARRRNDLRRGRCPGQLEEAAVGRAHGRGPRSVPGGPARHGHHRLP